MIDETGAPSGQKDSVDSLIKGSGGSMTVEALLILPIILILMALFLRWGLMLQKDLRDAAESEPGTAWEGSVLLPDGLGGGLGFDRGGPPARRIRDADLLLDFAYGIKEYLPSWF